MRDPSFDLVVSELGSCRVRDGRVEPLNGQAEAADFSVATDRHGLLALAGGVSPLKLMLNGRIRVRGSRRHVSKLRTLADSRFAGDAMLRMLVQRIDPQRTRGHVFVIAVHVDDRSWFVHVNDGAVSVTRDTSSADAHVRLAAGELRRMVAGDIDLDPRSVEGLAHAANLLVRWIRADEDELRREERQRLVQANRDWAESDFGRAYAQWEREAWNVLDIDLTKDKQHWLAAPGAAQHELIERVGAMAATSVAVRHVAFFDRFAAEVLALDADDVRGRMRELGDRGDPLAEGASLLEHLEARDLYPGLREGLRLIARDEQRELAFRDARPRG